MGKVFALHVPEKRDKNTGAFAPVFNIAPAAEFGDIEVILPPSSSFFATSSMMIQLAEALKKYDPTQDYILAIGDPAIIAGAGAILGKRFESFKLLKWDRMISRYVPLSIQL